MDIKEQLKLAAIDSIVSENTGTSTFEKMLDVAFNASAAFYIQVKETEEAIKTEYSLSKMPSPWRSAKSVCYQCLKLGIGLIDENGNYLGKTALQNKIKERKGISMPEACAKDRLNIILNKYSKDYQIEILGKLLEERT
jgi:hypothetical protein